MNLSRWPQTLREYGANLVFIDPSMNLSRWPQTLSLRRVISMRRRVERVTCSEWRQALRVAWLKPMPSRTPKQTLVALTLVHPQLMRQGVHHIDTDRRNNWLMIAINFEACFVSAWTMWKLRTVEGHAHADYVRSKAKLLVYLEALKTAVDKDCII